MTDKDSSKAIHVVAEADSASVDQTIGKMRSLSDQLKEAAKLNELQIAEFAWQQGILNNVEKVQLQANKKIYMKTLSARPFNLHNCKCLNLKESDKRKGGKCYCQWFQQEVDHVEHVLQREKAEAEKLIDELMSLNKKQTDLETMNKQQSEKNAQLEAVIGMLAVAIQEKKRLIEDVKFFKMDDGRKFQIQSKEMEEHKKRIFVHEKVKPIFKDLDVQQKTIENLQVKRDKLHAKKTQGNGSVEEQMLEDKIIGLGKLKKDLSLQAEVKEQQAKKIIEKQLQVQQEIKVIKKHNAARLLRLRCQLKEAQAHTRCSTDSKPKRLDTFYTNS